MNTILVFTTSTGRAQTDMLIGLRNFAITTDWNIQTFEYDGTPLPVKKLIDFWKPIGCIAEVCGNSLAPDAISRKDFGNLPIVYIGSESYSPSRHSACVVHDAKLAVSVAAKELMTIGMSHFAFVGAINKGWSNRRKVAFEEALKLNGYKISAIDVHPTSAVIYAHDSIQLKNWLLSLPKPCGIMAADDEIAAAVLSICRHLNIDVPNDISVIGTDDNEALCMSTMPTLSSVRPNFRQGGNFAARLLAQIINDSNGIKHETVFEISGITRRGSTRVFKRKDPEVNAALERIWGTDGVKLSPKEVFAGFSCSRRNAEIRFRRATGKSVLKEIVTARISRAKELLSETILTIPEIAEMCGYRFPANFRNAFHEATGCNPLAWRKANS